MCIMAELTDFLKKSKVMNIVKKKIIERKLQDLKDEKKFIKVNKGDKLY